MMMSEGRVATRTSEEVGSTVQSYTKILHSHEPTQCLKFKSERRMNGNAKRKQKKGYGCKEGSAFRFCDAFLS